MANVTRPRSERGPRTIGRDVHYDLCDGPSCPCYREAIERQRIPWWAASVLSALLVGGGFFLGVGWH